jgi:ubiquinone/menaquinone biosynthesis C-methylase UbiE
MDYGDIEAWLVRQSDALGITIPMVKGKAEDLPFDEGHFDVTMCISTIEHVGPEVYHKALQELVRVTKPGGYIFITSDFFESEDKAQLSNWLHVQHNRMTVQNMPGKILETIQDQVEMVGAYDYSYRGDMVNNYSFCNICLHKTA